MEKKDDDLKNLFFEHVWLFVDNAKMILENERLFYTPISDYRLPYAPKDKSWHPILGVFVEWWLYHPQASRDVNGNPVVFFNGSPMTGSHACSSISPNGTVIDRCHLNVGWIKTMKTFYEVDSKYRENHGKVAAMDLHTAIEYIEKNSTEEERKLTALESRIYELEGLNASLIGKIEESKRQMGKMREDFLRLIAEHYKKEIEEFINKLQVCEEASRKYKQKTSPIRTQLKKDLKAGKISPKEYQKQVGEIRKQQEKLDSDLHHCEYELERELSAKYNIYAPVSELKDIMGS